MLSSDPKAPNIEASLRWIIPALESFKVPYQIVGGLAAKFHGARRPLVDIDFYVDMRASGFSSFLEKIRAFLIWGPQYYKDESWDITFMKIDYREQRIEIGDSNDAKFHDKTAGVWTSQAINYEEFEVFQVHGLALRVMPKQALITYKMKLGREVDNADLADLVSRRMGE